ncbi:MAG TPA: helix-turn-helix transcriptional regulator [Bacillales bacterium]|nr:helix-turn-helix transcriptional regulator [Bacillales bacterium]
MVHVGNVIRDKRKQLHLTQGEVAGEYMSISKLSNIENGKIIPDPRTWGYLQRKLRLSDELSLQKQYVEKVGFLLEQAGTYETAGLKEKAMENYHEAAEMASHFMLSGKAGKAYQKLGGLYTESKQYDLALNCLEKALGYLELTDDWEQKVICELKYSVVFYKEEKYVESLEHAKLALKRIPDGEDSMRGAVHYDIACAYYRLQMIDRANHECEQALSYLAEENGDYYIAALILHGILLKKAKMYLLAEKKHREARELSFSRGKTYYLGLCWHNLGDVAMESGHFEKALECFRLAMEVKEQTGDTLGIIRTKTYRAELYYRMGDNDNALKSAEEVLADARKLQLKTDEFFIVRTLGKIHAALGDERQYLDLAYKAMTLADELAFDNEKAELLGDMADFYYRQGNQERCLEKLYQAFLVKSQYNDVRQEVLGNE